MVVVSVNSDVLLASVEFLIHLYVFLVYTINLPQLLYHNIFYKKILLPIDILKNDNTSLFENSCQSCICYSVFRAKRKPADSISYISA